MSRALNKLMKRKRDYKGRFEPEYDWGDLIPLIIDEYIEGTPIAVQCRNHNYPSWSQVMRVIKANPELLEKYKVAIWIKYQMLGSDYDEIRELAEAAFHDKSRPVNPLRIMLSILNLKSINLERMAATYGVRL